MLKYLWKKRRSIERILEIDKFVYKIRKVRRKVEEILKNKVIKTNKRQRKIIEYKKQDII